MAYAGADGATREEMAEVLHYPPGEVGLHASFAALRIELDELQRLSAKTSKAMQRYGATNDPFILMVANRLFGQTGYAFRPAFLSLVKDNYDAPLEQLNFVKASAEATRRINDWAEAQTRQRICGLVPDGALTNLTRLVLVNAIYLKAPWAEPFQALATKPGPFRIRGDKSFDVPTMTQTLELSYAKSSGFAALQIPFGGQELRLLVLLPDKVKGLATLERKLTPDLLVGRMRWELHNVTLYLPKFKIEPPMLPLAGVLQTLGMKSAFNRPVDSANFDRMAPRRDDDYRYLSEVFHKTFLSLDEKWAEAAAATAVHATYYGGNHELRPPIEFRVDRPFLFAIQYASSGACLFLGHVVNPR
jgi:serpin B